MRIFGPIYRLGLLLVIGIGCSKHLPSADKDAVLPDRRLSEHQVADIVARELPQQPAFTCDFKDGMWLVSAPQKGVWGVSSITTNADGHIFVQSTNAMRLILKVRDADGIIERVQTP